MKQIDIAKKAGVSTATVSGILTGKRAASWTAAKKLAAATNTAPEIWMDGPTKHIHDAIRAAEAAEIVPCVSHEGGGDWSEASTEEISMALWWGGA